MVARHTMYAWDVTRCEWRVLDWTPVLAAVGVGICAALVSLPGNFSLPSAALVRVVILLFSLRTQHAIKRVLYLLCAIFDSSDEKAA